MKDKEERKKLTDKIRNCEVRIYLKNSFIPRKKKQCNSL